MIQQQPKGRIAATLGGTVWVIGHSDDLARDVADALQQIDAAVPLSRDEIARLIQMERVSAGLRAEAGVSSSGGVIILHSHSERLATGVLVYSWLTLCRTPAGDAVYWNVAVREALIPCATRSERNVLLFALRCAAGGESTEVRDTPTEAPSEDDIRATEAL